ncbi:hypothetical protein CEXT_691981 [Caerostris extrusa]|nr:hypothetical protein CEXT_691981 [Caerostris extrusa]
MEENLTDYIFKKLTEPEGKVEACNKGVCCFVEYLADSMTENFTLLSSTTLRNFSYEVEDVLQAYSLEGQLQQRDRLSFSSSKRHETGAKIHGDHHHHDIKRDIHVDVAEGADILVVGLKGRCYDRDPPT